jgi:hypothetical protein
MTTITLSQDELNMLNILTGNAQQLQNELARVANARLAAIALLELKYIATFDPITGIFSQTEKPAEA